MTLPKKCLVDTNVPKTANLALSQSEIPREPTDCVDACVYAITHVIKNDGLVIDNADENIRAHNRGSYLHLPESGQWKKLGE